MGDETTQFATRFSNAVKDLAELASDAGHAKLLKRHGAKLPAAVREALEAVAAVHKSRTTAVRNWPEQRQRVLDQIAMMRTALERAGVDAEVRRMVGALVEMIESKPGS